MRDRFRAWLSVGSSCVALVLAESGCSSGPGRSSTRLPASASRSIESNEGEVLRAAFARFRSVMEACGSEARIVLVSVRHVPASEFATTPLVQVLDLNPPKRLELSRSERRVAGGVPSASYSVAWVNLEDREVRQEVERLNPTLAESMAELTRAEPPEAPAVAITAYVAQIEMGAVRFRYRGYLSWNESPSSRHGEFSFHDTVVPNLGEVVGETLPVNPAD